MLVSGHKEFFTGGLPYSIIYQFYLNHCLQVIGSVARNTVGRYLAFDFIRDKWAVVKD